MTMEWMRLSFLRRKHRRIHRTVEGQAEFTVESVPFKVPWGPTGS